MNILKISKVKIAALAMALAATAALGSMTKAEASGCACSGPVWGNGTGCYQQGQCFETPGGTYAKCCYGTFVQAGYGCTGGC
jgi:hypothetical protein